MRGVADVPGRHRRHRLTQALYNRIRPRTFSPGGGAGACHRCAGAALTSGRLHHAFLFSGPRGCGKTSSARILAASLNCVTGPTPTPCGVCEHCVAIRSGSSMDVIEIDAASHRGIDDAREIRERAIFMPASARFKVYIIDEAHQITSDAFNALLKLVEEPPPHLKFVFATTEPDKVLQTIRSRTHHYAFRLVPPAMLREFLAKVASTRAPCRSGGAAARGARRGRVGARQPLGARSADRRRRPRRAHRQPMPRCCSAFPMRPCSTTRSRRWRPRRRPARSRSSTT